MVNNTKATVFFYIFLIILSGCNKKPENFTSTESPNYLHEDNEVPDNKMFDIDIQDFQEISMQRSYDFLQKGRYQGSDNPLISYHFLSPNKVEYSAHYSYYENPPRVITKSGIYGIHEDNGVPFLNIRWDNNETEKYLMLIGDHVLFLYNGDGEPAYSFRYYPPDSDSEGDRYFSHIEPMRDITASSSLVDGGIAYTPDKIGLKINSVWAEGANGHGIHEKLFMPKPTLSDELYLSIGYVAYSKPYLYRENSRPRRIRVSMGGEANYKDIELDDTPNFQTINLSDIDIVQRDIPVDEWQIQIEILDVYPGTKYEDTCINALLFRWSQ